MRTIVEEKRVVVMSKSVVGMAFAAMICVSANAFAGFFLDEGVSVPVVSRAEVGAKPGGQDVNTKAPVCEFSIIAGDDTLEAAIKRWALASGWQAPQWNYRTVYVDYYSSFCGDGGFEGAVDRVMTAENAAGIPLFATFHSNRVVVIDGGK